MPRLSESRSPNTAGPWVASALFAALVARPRETRIVASMLAATAVSDFLHQAYTFVRHAS